MTVSSIGNNADMLGGAGLAQNVTADAASMGVLKKAMDASAALGADLVALASGSNVSSGQLDVYA